MNHEMKLFPEPFGQIMSGSKTIEIRLNDEKRQMVKVGDTITFHNTDNVESLRVEVLELLRFDTFRQLYESLSSKAFGCAGKSMEWMLDETHKIYTPEREKKYGALGIRISLI